MPDDYFLKVHVISTRDDEDTAPAEQLGLPAAGGKKAPFRVPASVVGPAKAANGNDSRMKLWPGSNFESWSGALSSW